LNRSRAWADWKLATYGAARSKIAARVLVLSLITGFTFPAGATAQPRTFALNWVRDANATSCIGSRELARRVENTLGPVFVTPLRPQDG
jgi:hypothetical protein